MSFRVQPYFVYEDLDQSQESFRLCRLLPGEASSAVQCDLFSDRISTQKGIYSALSYAWGEISEPRWIMLNGKPFIVQPSLLQALNAIRSHDLETLIWIDAICINQAEVSERNHQVTMMGDIYRNAKRVLAWLGPAADDSDAYFNYLENLNHPDEGQTEEMKELATRAVTFLNKRSYWRRAWIKQELILAKDITLYCGSRSHASMSFFWFASLFTIDLVKGYEDFMCKLFFHRGIHETLEELLHRYTNTECSDPRDRVFSLFSMASDCQGQERKLVDYSLSIPALFFALIAHFKPSNVLKFATVLQDALLVRRVELIKYWNLVSADNTLNASSPMEELAFDYICKVKSHGKSVASGLSNFPAPDIIAQSFLAANTPELLKGRDRLFLIEGTKFYLLFKHTLFGFHFQGVYQSNGDENHDERVSLVLFSTQFTVEQVWKSMILPTVVIDTDNEHVMKPGLIADIKEAVVNNHGQDAVNPEVDIICYTLAELGQRSSNMIAYV